MSGSDFSNTPEFTGVSRLNLNQNIPKCYTFIHGVGCSGNEVRPADVMYNTKKGGE
jgi:hypothetical protein